MEMRDPDARNGKMWASPAAAGRNGRFRLHVCVDWMVPPSGSWAEIPGMLAVCLFVNGASVVTKCPVAPVSRTAGDFGGEEA
jgi:hypothetical protein